MQLSQRLKMICSMVTEGNTVAEAGCDHGYIPIYLVRAGIVPKAIAMDVNAGPLQRAQQNIRAYGLEAYIETRLSDGVAMLQPGEAQSLVIAGLGGALMGRILEDGMETAASAAEWILQPQSEIDQVRRFLERYGYRIEAERMVCEDGKYYTAMRAVKGKPDYREEIDFLFGKRLLECRDEVLRVFLQEEERKLHEILRMLSGQSGEAAAERSRQLHKKQQLVHQALNNWQEA